MRGEGATPSHSVPEAAGTLWDGNLVAVESSAAARRTINNQLTYHQDSPKRRAGKQERRFEMTIHKQTRRELAAYEAMTDEALATAWLAIPTKRTKAGAIRVAALRESDWLLAAAQRRNLSLPCEDETLAQWNVRHAAGRCHSCPDCRMWVSECQCTKAAADVPPLTDEETETLEVMAACGYESALEGLYAETDWQDRYRAERAAIEARPEGERFATVASDGPEFEAALDVLYADAIADAEAAGTVEREAVTPAPKVTATIIPVADDLGSVRHVYVRGENAARLFRFMEARGLEFCGDWHGFQQPTFAESVDMARGYGVTGDEYRAPGRYDDGVTETPGPGYRYRDYPMQGEG